MSSTKASSKPKPPSSDEIVARGLVEVADTGGHWYWLGDVHYEGIDPVPTLMHEHQAWPAIRLLLPAPGSQRVRHVNACGLRTCVNPEHWKLVPLRQQAVVTNFDGKGWRKSG